MANQPLPLRLPMKNHMIPFGWNTEKIKKRWKERFGEYKYKMLLDFNECDKAR